MNRHELVLTLTCVALLPSCSEQLPGEVVGAYDVVWQLEENSCGPAQGYLPADGARFAIELRAEGTRAFWRVPSPGPAPREGTYDQGSFRFELGPFPHELGNGDAGTAGCTVLQKDVLVGRIEAADESARGDAGQSSRTRLVAELEVTFRSDVNGRCRDVRGPLGPFDAIPCSARYSLLGSQRGKF